LNISTSTVNGIAPVLGTARLTTGARGSRRCWHGAAVLTALLLATGAPAHADEPAASFARYAGAAIDASLEVALAESYALGVNEFDLNHRSKITGWQVAQGFGGQWYFGQKDGDGSGLSLVWQKSADQVSISTDGIRFTRLF
jgi:hypothetical protein